MTSFAMGLRRLALRSIIGSLPAFLGLAAANESSAATLNVDYLVVAGGGGGGSGSDSSNNGGGGGAGGLLFGNPSVSGTVPVVVGAGGIGGSHPQAANPTRSTNG